MHADTNDNHKETTEAGRVDSQRRRRVKKLAQPARAGGEMRHHNEEHRRCDTIGCPWRNPFGFESIRANLSRLAVNSRPKKVLPLVLVLIYPRAKG
jgi:hypothetical protein